MSVRDFPARTTDGNLPWALLQWLDEMARRHNIDGLTECTDPQDGDELILFDASANTVKKLKLSTLKTYVLA